MALTPEQQYVLDNPPTFTPQHLAWLQAQQAAHTKEGLSLMDADIEARSHWMLAQQAVVARIVDRVAALIEQQQGR